MSPGGVNRAPQVFSACRNLITSDRWAGKTQLLPQTQLNPETRSYQNHLSTSRLRKYLRNDQRKLNIKVKPPFKPSKTGQWVLLQLVHLYQNYFKTLTHWGHFSQNHIIFFHTSGAVSNFYKLDHTVAQVRAAGFFCQKQHTRGKKVNYIRQIDAGLAASELL